jgi:UDP-galactopyranose mutase
LEIAIVGAGFSGAVVARELAQAGHRVDVFDDRDHVAGNCHTRRDAETGVMLHVYGPHIFHTGFQHVWEYVNRFGRFEPYSHRVKATTRGRVFTLPVNLLTINQFFGKTLSPRQAADFVASLGDATITEPVSFRDQGLRFLGKDLYEAFFDGYTRKQWGVDPSELPASILKRLPVRFNYDDNYFDHPYMGMPTDGYTTIVEAVLDHHGITVHLGQRVGRPELAGYDHCFWSGPIDGYFDHVHGALGYRTLDFELERHSGDYQGCPVMNYCDHEVPHTRITEFKHFTPWEKHENTVIYREFSRASEAADIPYYPIRQVREKALLGQYVELARSEQKTTFLGRLGTYRYLDMDVTIKEGLDAAARFLECVNAKGQVPAFFTDPLG